MVHVNIEKVHHMRSLVSRCKDLSTPLQVSLTLLTISPERLTFRTTLMGSGFVKCEKNL